MAALLLLGPRHQRHHGVEVGVLTGVHHQRRHFALLDDRICISRLRSPLADGKRLAGHGRLVHQQIVAVEENQVCRDDVTEAKPDDVSRDQFTNRDLLPSCITDDCGVAGEALFESSDGVQSSMLLCEIDASVYDQHDRDNDEVVPFQSHR